MRAELTSGGNSTKSGNIWGFFAAEHHRWYDRVATQRSALAATACAHCGRDIKHNVAAGARVGEDA
jgi:hypothetical protein